MAHQETCGATRLVLVQGPYCAGRLRSQVHTALFCVVPVFFFKKPPNTSDVNELFLCLGYADPGSMAGDWQPRGSVRMSTMKRTSIPSFATLHEVSNVDEAHHDGITPVFPLQNGSFFIFFFAQQTLFRHHRRQRPR